MEVCFVRSNFGLVLEESFWIGLSLGIVLV
jgi:hypothetical protein